MSEYRASQDHYHYRGVACPRRSFLQTVFTCSSLKKKGLIFFSLTIFLTLFAGGGVLYSASEKWGYIQAAGSVSIAFAPSLWLIGPLFLLLCLLAGGMVFYLRSIIAPLENIDETVQKMTEGALDKPIMSRHTDEIGLVGIRINDFAMNMQEILLYLWNHVQKNDALLYRISGQLKGEENDGRVSSQLSTDFTRICEDNEELKSIIRSFSYFEVKLEQEKMLSEPIQESVDAQQ